MTTKVDPKDWPMGDPTKMNIDDVAKKVAADSADPKRNLADKKVKQAKSACGCDVNAPAAAPFDMTTKVDPKDWPMGDPTKMNIDDVAKKVAADDADPKRNLADKKVKQTKPACGCDVNGPAPAPFDMTTKVDPKDWPMGDPSKMNIDDVAKKVAADNADPSMII